MVHVHMYHITEWRDWDHTIHQAVVDFYQRFDALPDTLMACTRSFHAIDMRVANSEQITNVRPPDDQEEVEIAEDAFISLSSFCTSEYELAFFLDEELEYGAFVLTHGINPETGEAVEEDDSDAPAPMELVWNQESDEGAPDDGDAVGDTDTEPER